LHIGRLDKFNLKYLFCNYYRQFDATKFGTKLRSIKLGYCYTNYLNTFPLQIPEFDRLWYFFFFFKTFFLSQSIPLNDIWLLLLKQWLTASFLGINKKSQFSNESKKIKDDQTISVFVVLIYLYLISQNKTLWTWLCAKFYVFVCALCLCRVSSISPILRQLFWWKKR